MGLPLGPTFANIFMFFYETKLLENCPSLFKPIFYKRYVDDTFILFRDASHPTLFHNYLNSQQILNLLWSQRVIKNCRFQIVTRKSNRSNTSVFRKNSSTGLSTSFFSFFTFSFKFNCLKTLVKTSIKKSLYSQRTKPIPVTTVDKRKVYLSLPYFSFQSVKLKQELKILFRINIFAIQILNCFCEQFYDWLVFQV